MARHIFCNHTVRDLGISIFCSRNLLPYWFEIYVWFSYAESYFLLFICRLSWLKNLWFANHLQNAFGNSMCGPLYLHCQSIPSRTVKA
jgi:hypothetical protein